MVALNFQTFDRAMQLNNAMFSLNGRAGYILKPDYQRAGQLKEHDRRNGLPAMTFTIKVISAQQLPKAKNSNKSVINPYIEIEVVSEEGENSKLKTRTIPNNGLNPIWNETFSFSIEDPDFAFIRFQVFSNSENISSSAELIASYTILATSIEQGYRHAPLFDWKGELQRFSSLFLLITFT